MPKAVLTSMLGIEVPIIQAPMILQSSLVPLAAAVSTAGGMGSLGCAEMSVRELDKSITAMRAATDRPFNLNFFLHTPPAFDPEVDAEARAFVAPIYERLGIDLPSDAAESGLEGFDDARLELLVDHAPAMVSFHFGCPDSQVVDRLKAAGIVTAATATTVAEARVLEEAGLDLIVAQGWEAGGHRGSFGMTAEDIGTGTLALVPQIVDAVDIPVVAAGGIADGRGIAAVLALGASGVWMGTAFLSCLEAPITPVHRQALRDASDEDTRLSRAFSGRPCRARRTPYSERAAAQQPRFPAFPLMYHLSGPLKRHGIAQDDLDYQFLLYGQAAALNRETSAEALIGALAAETREAIKALSELV